MFFLLYFDVQNWHMFLVCLGGWVGGWSSSNNVFAPVSTSQSLRPRGYFFKVFRHFSDIVFFIDLVDFWTPSGSIFDPFPDLFTSSSATFWHLDFTSFFQCLLNGFVHHV